MNNYFGIGLDAKISLDFNNKRDEHPEKCRYKKKQKKLHVLILLLEKETDCNKSPVRLIYFFLIYFQESDEKHDVVRSSWNQRAAAQNLQEPGTESFTRGEIQNDDSQFTSTQSVLDGLIYILFICCYKKYKSGRKVQESSLFQ